MGEIILDNGDSHLQTPELCEEQQGSQMTKSPCVREKIVRDEVRELIKPRYCRVICYMRIHGGDLGRKHQLSYSLKWTVGKQK